MDQDSLVFERIRDIPSLRNANRGVLSDIPQVVFWMEQRASKMSSQTKYMCTSTVAQHSSHRGVCCYLFLWRDLDVLLQEVRDGTTRSCARRIVSYFLEGHASAMLCVVYVDQTSLFPK